jgi:Domain of unknown function (DUF2760)
MEQKQPAEKLSFFGRLGLACKLLFNTDCAARVQAGLAALEAGLPKIPAEKLQASALLLLGAMQREGRLIDFLQQEVAAFSDEEVGAAARVVHSGCRKVLRQYFDLEPARPEAEGSAVTLPAGFDAQRVRLTGNVAGQPPFRGALKHHGWVARAVRLPEISDAVDARVIAPAEVELS